MVAHHATGKFLLTQGLDHGQHPLMIYLMPWPVIDQITEKNQLAAFLVRIRNKIEMFEQRTQLPILPMNIADKNQMLSRHELPKIWR
ncbi:hypothetical protein C6C11_19270 [Aeromonas hydrophila]|uniref:Uncharacterized protein n=1 Tax=Aeromonas hydrophila TaxID=644 RepID=A0ABD7G3F2_AERHY|nr:hypothetical protein C6C11_19270 [Aeromonas hydrophila]